MIQSDTDSAPASAARSAGLAPRARVLNYVRLARPAQWAKGAFVLIGPLYGMALSSISGALAVAAAFIAFALGSSACYVVNDIADRHADRTHPRKKLRPIAAGAVSVRSGAAFACVLALVAVFALMFIPASPGPLWRSPRMLVAYLLAGYVANVVLYSLFFKRLVVLDVMSLAAGFALRVLAGCAAVAVEPSPWLLNVTLFVAMFLALGKRLGERRILGDDAARSRSVLARYPLDFLRMAVVVTGVATLLTYAQYTQAQAPAYTRGFNLLWLTMLPATYGLLRAMVLLERGDYDDPTEMALHDRPFQAAVAAFGILTLVLLFGVKAANSSAVAPIP